MKNYSVNTSTTSKAVDFGWTNVVLLLNNSTLLQ